VPRVNRLPSWLVVACVCAALGAAHAAPSVAVDVSRLESADAAALEQALVMRLIQEGFAIDPTANAAIVVAIASSDSQVVLSAKSANFERSRTVDISGSSDAQLQLEVVQKVVELARLAREAAPPPSRPPAVAVATPPERDVIEENVVVHEPAPRWRIGVDAGVLMSATMETALSARVAIAYGFGAAVRASMSAPDGQQISVSEQDALAGASYERSLSRTVAFDVSLVAGVHRHHFELAMPLGEQTGTRYDREVAAPVRLSLRVWRALDLSIWALAKIGREREHTSETTVLWHRDAFDAGVGVGVAARF
jgi:hypothetical protein